MADKDLMAQYQGLEYPPEFKSFIMRSTPSEKDCYLNGVGSPEGGWLRRVLYHLTPDTVWGLNIRLVANIHDFRYEYPFFFSTRQRAMVHKAKADMEFRDNLVTYIYANTKWKWLRNIRLDRAEFYYSMLQSKGDKSFFSDKIIAEEAFNR